MRVASGARRAFVTALGVLSAAVVGGVLHGTLPLVGGSAPHAAGLRGAGGALGAAGTLAHVITSHPAVLLEAAILAAVAVALPHVAGKGLRWSVGLGAGMLAAMTLALPGAAPLSLAAPLAACSIAVAAFSMLRQRDEHRSASPS